MKVNDEQNLKPDEESKTKSHHEVPPDRLAYNVRETAYLLGGIDEDTVRRLLKSGKLHCSNDLKTRLIPKWEIEDYLKKNLGPWKSCWSDSTYDSWKSKRDFHPRSNGKVQKKSATQKNQNNERNGHE